MNAEYPINYLSDFLKVPADKQAECLRDFYSVLNSWRQMAPEKRAISNSFVWIDDGEQGISGTRYLVNGVEVARIPGGGQ